MQVAITQKIRIFPLEDILMIIKFSLLLNLCIEGDETAGNRLFKATFGSKNANNRNNAGKTGK